MLANVVLGFLWGGIICVCAARGRRFRRWILGPPRRISDGWCRQAPSHRRVDRPPSGRRNHVWLIFALVVTWTGFPSVFAAIASTLYIPLTAVAIGIILRGSAFAFRGAVTGLSLQRPFGAAFAHRRW